MRAGELLHNRPQLLPDGRGLVLTIATGDLEATQVAIYSSPAGEIFTLFPDVLFEGYCGGWPHHANYDVTPDGQRFVTGGQVDIPYVRLVVVLNWLTEMLEMVGG